MIQWEISESEEEFTVESAVRESNGVALSALVLGILACVFNLLFFLAPIGIILGIIAIVMGAVSRRKHRYGKAGFILGLLSYVPVLAYALSYIAIKMADPFF